MKKIKSFTALLLALSICAVTACSSQPADNSSVTESASATESSSSTATSDTSSGASTEESSETSSKPEKPVTDFTTYVSNTVVSTGNNFYIEKAENITYRAYLPVEQYGELEYKFFFTNMVDSTYAKGKDAFVGKDGGAYTVSNAVIADGGTSTEDEITNRTPVTFGGKITKEVASDESYWSDPVTMNIPEGHYMVWEWTVSGEGIPCNKMASLTSTASSADGETFEFCDEIPLPQLIGAKRDVKHTVAAIGDSITQGCQTEQMKYEFWASKISTQLGSDVSFFNCGLGWARASDAASNENWLSRVSQYDTVIVAFGTNDIVSGKYGGKKSTAEEIEEYLDAIVSYLTEKGCDVILFNAPPQDFKETNEGIRTALNEKIPSIAEKYGAKFFDFSALLSTEDEPAKAVYGGHPNGEGGTVVADAFVKQFGSLFE
ncbi:MAG: SGNH/GDSL hydrolase family protein [Ruminiclostridium sp.]|nr:SGNH/GDSL hydrolase family protein [Ruminiclostridium sp.]